MKVITPSPAVRNSGISTCHDYTPAQFPILSESQENINPKGGVEEITDFSFDFAFAYTFKEPLASADQLFCGGKIKTININKDSDPLIPKPEEENSSKSRKSKPKDNSKQVESKTKTKGSSDRSFNSNSSSWKWKPKDFFLFRSASEGHDYGVLEKSDNGKSGLGLSGRSKSMQATRSGGERRRKSDGISAHERHYVKNKAAAEEMRRKSFLPYKKTLLGCSDLDPGVYEY